MHFNKYIIIARDSGGIGDYVCLTALIRFINIRWPQKRIILLVGNKECFANNPRIFRLILLDNIWIKRFVRGSIKILSRVGIPVYNYLYMNWATGMGDFIKSHPYMHYVEVLSRHMDLDIDYSYPKNEIFFSEKELVAFQEKYRNFPEEYVLVQSTGKTTFTFNKEVGSKRVQKIVKSYRELNWVQIGSDSDPLLENCKDYRGKTVTLRELFYVIMRAKAVMCLEGAYNHIAAAFNVKSITLFTGFSPVAVYSYSSTVGIQKDHLPSCSPCMLRDKCPNNMQCVDDEISEKAVEAISALRRFNTKNL